MKSTQPGIRHINRIVWLAFFLALISTNCVKIKSASEDLIGVWKASNIRYSDTYFEIEKESITFRTKEGDRNSYTIIEIKKEQMKDKVWVLYTIFYRDQDLQKVEFPFYFQTTDRGVIKFKNQPHLVWKKENGITT